MNRLTRTVLAAALLITANITTQAQTAAKNTTTNARVQYISSEDNAWVFKINFEAEGAVKTSIRIQDEEGRELYNEQFSDKQFSKFFKLSKDSGRKFTFIIVNGRQQFARSFEMVTRYREEVIETAER
jgi:hypothetical protein